MDKAQCPVFKEGFAHHAIGDPDAGNHGDPYEDGNIIPGLFGHRRVYETNRFKFEVTKEEEGGETNTDRVDEEQVEGAKEVTEITTLPSQN